MKYTCLGLQVCGTDNTGIMVDTFPSPVEATHFQLYKRAKHVFSEALRVLKFRQVCLDAASSPPETVMQTLGDLMNESQTSCRDLYECSCPELDELTRLAREAGAVASRLTGMLNMLDMPVASLTLFIRRWMGRMHRFARSRRTDCCVHPKGQGYLSALSSLGRRETERSYLRYQTK